MYPLSCKRFMHLFSLNPATLLFPTFFLSSILFAIILRKVGDIWCFPYLHIFLEHNYKFNELCVVLPSNSLKFFLRSIILQFSSLVMLPNCSKAFSLVLLMWLLLPTFFTWLFFLDLALFLFDFLNSLNFIEVYILSDKLVGKFSFPFLFNVLKMCILGSIFLQWLSHFISDYSWD